MTIIHSSFNIGVLEPKWLNPELHSQEEQHMMRFDPFREIEEMTQRMDRAFASGGAQTTRFAPPVDVHEDEQGLELTLDIPGVKPEDIQIEAENQTLTVQAERRYSRGEGAPCRARLRHLYPHLQRARQVRPDQGRGRLRPRHPLPARAPQRGRPEAFHQCPQWGAARPAEDRRGRAARRRSGGHRVNESIFTFREGKRRRESAVPLPLFAICRGVAGVSR